METEVSNLIKGTSIESFANVAISTFKSLKDSFTGGGEFTQVSILKSMRPILEYHMEVNAQAKYVRDLYKQNGINVSGQTTRPNITTAVDALYPTHVSTEDANYLMYSQNIQNTEKTSTSYTDITAYPKVENLWYDDLGIGENFGETDSMQKVEQKIFADDEAHDATDTVLSVTKQLFRNRKINSIISAFHTSNKDIETDHDARTIFGLSHGRNLLTKKAERTGVADTINGYDNPYCRVWTHHHQYDQLYKMIRPFNVEGEPTRTTSTHRWKNFVGQEDYEGDDKAGQRAWKDGKSTLWKYSVLDSETGLLNIAPKFKNGGTSNVHTKQCMFSIENLAWQGYDPYSFKKALSWEQRGPMGGRIMWFPPYGLQFTETTNVGWNSQSFIGRGEDVYTYSNTRRTGTLQFMMVVDHPSVIDYALHDEENRAKILDTDLLRFFAGCDSGDGTTGGEAEIGSGLSEGSSLFSIAKPTPLTDEYIRKSDKATAEKVEDASIPDIKIPDADEIILRFGVFYPNNYSGYWDSDETAIAKSNSKVDAIAYLLFGKGCQKQHNESKDEFDNNDDIEIRFDDVTNSDGPGYEMNINSTEGSGISIVENENKNEAPKYTNEIKRNKLLWNEWKKLNYKKFIKDPNNIWYYRIDGYYPTNGISSGDEYRNCYDQLLSSEKNYIDNYSFAYNSKYSEGITKLYNAESTESNENNVYYYSLAEIAYVLSQNEKYKEKISSVLQDDFKTDRINILNDLIGKDRKYIISKISSTGWSNAQANNASSTLNSQRNNHLATERANTAVRWFKKYANCADVTTEGPTVNSSHSLAANALNNTNADEAKLYRSATVEVYLKRDTSKDVAESETSDNNSSEFEYSEYIGYTKKELNGKTYYVNESDPSKLWQLKNGEMVWADDYLNGLNDSYGLEATVNADGVTEYPNGVDAKYGQKYSNFYRYDQEYHFFQALELTDKMTFDALTTKLRYFVPAYHSTTPEGFNARLTFLQQCTRQGNTVGSTDVDSKSANNLAFGRPPYCVLRLGDFYNQMIVIDNISINYDQTLDINIEGIGVQPLIANVSLSFTFIGGGDITGPIKRLQNAMSFNYYANASLYDNRADHVEYNWDAKASGAIDHSMKNDSSYFNDIAMQNNT